MNSAAFLILIALSSLKGSETAQHKPSELKQTRIGPAAKDALPALRKALHDRSKDVSRFAEQAIKSILKE